MTNDTLASMRQEYGRLALDREHLANDPAQQLSLWLAEAITSEGEIEANAMTLATVDSEGRPSARMVLLKAIVNGRLVFFTNQQSRKGYELASNDRCAIVFWWPTWQRQVRVEGRVSIADQAYAQEYFDARPLGSRLGAIVSPQSQVVAHRSVLEDALKIEIARHEAGHKPKMPTHWGGYWIHPDRFEFWQGRENRLHDRWQYDLQPDSSWLVNRLAP